MYQAKSGVKNISLYWDWVPAPFSLYWGGCPLTKIFFPSLNMYQAKSGVKYFSLYWGGCPSIKFFFPVWTCIKPNLVSKLFPFTGGRGGSLDKNFFSGLNMYQAKSGVKNVSLYWDWVPAPFSLYGGGCPLTKIFFPSLNMYQAKSGVKNFSLYWGGVPRQKNFFQSEHVSSQIWCQKFFPLLGGGPSTKIFFPSLNMYQAKSGVKNFSLYWGGSPQEKNFFQSEHVSSQIWCQKIFPLLRPGHPPKNLRLGTPPKKSETWDPPQKIWDLGPPLPKNLRPGTPSLKIWDLGPPLPKNLRPGTPSLKIWDLGPPPKIWDLGPPPKSEQTDISKYKYYLPSYYVRGR